MGRQVGHVRHVWQNIDVNRIYAAGAELSTTAQLALPADAPQSTPIRPLTFPFFQWYIVPGLSVPG